MKTIKGWRTISKEGGYLNENTGQTLTISKKQFGQTYHVSLFVGKKTDEADSKRISPEFATTSKAQAYAFNLMEKHPNGIA
ncbi:MAG: hypothetical protein NWE93_10270 [Candidatus Bathyarchaeota archaeon]|nr:hypothetical protein [Candidatus Bathyarchaeota archaeon]